MRKNRQLILYLLPIVITFLFLLSNQAYATKTGQEIVAEAKKYADYTWTVGKDNEHNCFSPGFKEGSKIKGVAYRWGGWDTPEEFQKKIDNKYLAGARKGKWDPVNKYYPPCCSKSAGIDCSGLVSRVAGFVEKKYTGNLDKYSQEIDFWNDVTEGDILLSGSHVMIFVSWVNFDKLIANVIHAAPYPDDGKPRRVVAEVFGDTSDEKLDGIYQPRRLIIPPRVISTIPENKATGVEVCQTITVTFSEPMDKASVENAFSISPSVSGTFSWEGDKILKFKPYYLKYGTTYTILIRD